MNMQKVTKMFKDLQKTVVKHGPEILTGIGIAGMITTTVLAVKATPKAMELIEEEKERLKEHEDDVVQLTVGETVKAAWKPYIPAMVTGVVSTGCLIGAQSINSRRNAALATAYQVSTAALNEYKEYKEKVVETIGEKKEQAIRDEIAKDRIEKNPPSEAPILITGKGNTLCYDLYSDRYFKSDIDRIKRAMNNLNYRMNCGMEMYISLNEFYDEIGLAHVKVGDDVGWRIDHGLIDIHFGSQLTEDDEPCVVIEHLVPPEYDYRKMY